MASIIIPIGVLIGVLIAVLTTCVRKILELKSQLVEVNAQLIEKEISFLSVSLEREFHTLERIQELDQSRSAFQAINTHISSVLHQLTQRTITPIQSLVGMLKVVRQSEDLPGNVNTALHTNIHSLEDLVIHIDLINQINHMQVTYQHVPVKHLFKKILIKFKNTISHSIPIRTLGLDLGTLYTDLVLFELVSVNLMYYLLHGYQVSDVESSALELKLTTNPKGSYTFSVSLLGTCSPNLESKEKDFINTSLVIAQLATAKLKGSLLLQSALGTTPSIIINLPPKV